MDSLERVHSQINQLKEGKYLAHREEITWLARILWDEEHIEKIVEASDENGISKGVIILTDQRLIVILKVYLTSEERAEVKKCLIEINDFSYKEIFDIYRQGGGKIGIESTRYHRRFSFILMNKGEDRSFCDYVDAKLLQSPKE